MNRLKTWLIKKRNAAVSTAKQIKEIFSRHFIKKISVIKTSLSALIKKYPFLNQSLALAKLFSIKISSKIFNLLNQVPFINKIIPVLHKKYLIFLSFAFLFSLFIFYFMSFLISSGKNLSASNSQNVSIQFLLNTQLDELELRSRRLPKKPKQEEPPPQTPKLKIQQTELQKPEMLSQLPQLDLPDDFQSDKKGAGVSAVSHQDKEVTPIFRIQPIYPRRAALRNIEGFVILQFDITSAGYTDNINVLQASPPQIFNSSAVQALRKWKYKPKIEKGRPVRQNNLKVQLDFNLRDQ